MSGFIFGHFMDGVMDRIEILVFCHFCKSLLARAGAVFSLYAHRQILLCGIRNDFTQ